MKSAKVNSTPFSEKEDHEKYRNCGDQVLRNFLNGLVVHLRGPMPKKEG